MSYDNAIYKNTYRDFILVSDESKREKIFKRLASTEVSFNRRGKVHTVDYTMESTDFYRGDTGCYLEELYFITYLFVEEAKISMSLYYSLYNAVEKVEGPSKRLDVVTRVSFNKLKSFYSEQAGAYIYPASERLVYDVMVLNESSSIFHISAFDFKLEL